MNDRRIRKNLKMNTKIKIGAMAAALLAAMATSLSAASLLNDSFNSYTDGNLVGQGGWTQVGSSTALPMQVNSGVVSMAQGSAQDADSDFSSSVTSGSIYYSLTINYSAKNGTADYGVAITDGGSSSFGGRLYAKSSGSGYVLAIAGSSTAPTVFGAELSFNTSYSIVVRYDIVAGATNDTASMYVTAGSFNANEASNSVYNSFTTWTGGSEVSSFTALLLRQGTNTGAFTVDNIKIGTLFSDVVAAVPEPSAFAAFAGVIALAGVVMQRRRKAVVA
jgi:trimeric autotransporter adhesin